MGCLGKQGTKFVGSRESINYFKLQCTQVLKVEQKIKATGLCCTSVSCALLRGILLLTGSGAMAVWKTKDEGYTTETQTSFVLMSWPAQEPVRKRKYC